MKASANKIALQRYVFGQKAVMPRTLQCNQFYRLKKSQKLKLLYSQEKKKKQKMRHFYVILQFRFLFPTLIWVLFGQTQQKSITLS